MRFFRRRRHERPLTEAEAYARSYGDRDGEVRLVTASPRPAPPPVARRPRSKLRLTGEELRRLFEERLDRREHGPG